MATQGARAAAARRHEKRPSGTSNGSRATRPEPNHRCDRRRPARFLSRFKSSQGADDDDHVGMARHNGSRHASSAARAQLGRSGRRSSATRGTGRAPLGRLLPAASRVCESRACAARASLGRHCLRRCSQVRSSGPHRLTNLAVNRLWRQRRCEDTRREHGCMSNSPVDELQTSFLNRCLDEDDDDNEALARRVEIRQTHFQHRTHRHSPVEQMYGGAVQTPSSKTACAARRQCIRARLSQQTCRQMAANKGETTQATPPANGRGLSPTSRKMIAQLNCLNLLTTDLLPCKQAPNTGRTTSSASCGDDSWASSGPTHRYPQSSHNAR